MKDLALQRKWIGGVGVVFGAGWLILIGTMTFLFLLEGLRKGFWSWFWTSELDAFSFEVLFSDESALMFPIGLLMILVLTLPGVFLVYFGVQLFRQMREGALRFLAGTFAIVLVLLWPIPFSEPLSSFVIGSVKIWPGLSLVFQGLVALCVYLVVVRFLLRHFLGQSPPCLVLISQWVVYLMAIEFFFFLDYFFMKFLPFGDGVSDGVVGLDGGRSMVSFLLSFAIAFVVFGIVLYERDKARVLWESELAGNGDGKCVGG